MKIHHVIEDNEERWEMDPVRGIVKRRSTILRPSETHTMVHDGHTYKKGKDGAFDVPHEVGKFYVGRPGWHEGPGITEIPTAEEVALDNIGEPKSLGDARARRQKVREAVEQES